MTKKAKKDTIVAYKPALFIEPTGIRASSQAGAPCFPTMLFEYFGGLRRVDITWNGWIPNYIVGQSQIIKDGELIVKRPSYYTISTIDIFTFYPGVGEDESVILGLKDPAKEKPKAEPACFEFRQKELTMGIPMRYPEYQKIMDIITLDPEAPPRAEIKINP